jgi:y4mF family transcriptional regulator
LRIKNSADFGQIIKQVRKHQKLRQIDLAAASGCGERFIIDLEKGKPTCELEKALRVAAMLGISLDMKPPD